MGADGNGHIGIETIGKPRVIRVRERTLMLPADLDAHLVLNHRAIVADCIRTGQAAPDFNDFCVTLLQLGYQTVVNTPEPTPPAPTEAPDAEPPGL